MTLHSNTHIEDLNDKTDLFNLREKGDAIKLFLESNIDAFKTDKMIAIYGNWGSGKTTLMKYIGKVVDKTKYTHLWFDTWKYEKDDNIGLSLLSVMTENVKKDESIKDLFKMGGILLKGFTKSISVNIPGVKFEAGKMIESFEEALAKEDENKSFHTKEKDFRQQFQCLENLIVEDKDGKTNKKIIVFIDDLDRCEPENVIDIMAMIKLFFTYGNRTIFICGVDKDSVSKAIRTRYQDIFKAEEYLEKIFDFSFSIKSSSSTDKLIDSFFRNNLKIKNELIIEETKIFFKAIQFNNPRHLKKVLNKFKILHDVSRNPDINNFPPALCNPSGSKQFVQVILAFYFIILHEFEHDYWFMYSDFEKKQNDIAQKLLTIRKDDTQSGELRYKKGILNTYSNEFNFQNSFHDVNEKIKNKHSEKAALVKTLKDSVIIAFLPSDFNSAALKPPSPHDSNNLVISDFKSKNNGIVLNFCEYIDNNFARLIESETELYPIENYIDSLGKFL